MVTTHAAGFRIIEFEAINCSLGNFFFIWWQVGIRVNSAICKIQMKGAISHREGINNVIEAILQTVRAETSQTIVRPFIDLARVARLGNEVLGGSGTGGPIKIDRQIGTCSMIPLP